MTHKRNCQIRDSINKYARFLINYYLAHKIGNIVLGWGQGVKTETEESYTSKSSFLDGDLLPKYGEKPKEYKFSGKRVEPGLYRIANGKPINADCLGAILKNVSTQLGLNLAKVRRRALTLPKRYDASLLTKSYRERSEQIITLR